MTQTFFVTQMERLKRRFGEKHFDAEFVRLASNEVGKMSERAFERTVDIWIGNRKIHDPPLMALFIEARCAEEKSNLAHSARGALHVVNGPAQFGGLKALLKEQFENCTSVNDAVDFVRLKNRIKDDQAK